MNKALDNRSLTEQVQDDDLLRDLFAVLDSVGVLQMTIENERIIQFDNRKLAQRLGFTDAELDRHPLLADIIHPQDRLRVATFLQQRLAGESVPESCEVGLLTSDGQRHEFELNAVLMPATDPPRIVLIGRDISECKAMAAACEQARVEAASLAQAHEAFLMQMNHELHTPLNAILGFAQLLQMDESLSEGQSERVNYIHKSGEHLLSTFNDILDHASLAGGKTELTLNEIALDDFLSNVVENIRVQADQKGLAFCYERTADLPAVIRGDEQRLRQVLLNLLSNAVKFCEQGQVSLRVGFAAPDRLQFEVSDSGRGIRESQLESIFQPFDQLAEEHPYTNGTGLGLAISRQLVRLMGGDIKVESRPGEGSLFAFELVMEIVHSGSMGSSNTSSGIGHARRQHAAARLDA